MVVKKFAPKKHLFIKKTFFQVRLNDFKSSFLFLKNDNFVNLSFFLKIFVRSKKADMPSSSFRFSAEKNKLQSLQWSMVLITDLFSAVIIPYYQERGQLALITLT